MANIGKTLREEFTDANGIIPGPRKANRFNQLRIKRAQYQVQLRRMKHESGLREEEPTAINLEMKTSKKKF